MFLDGGVQVDEIFGQLIKSGSAVTINRTVRCYDGYLLSCETVGDIAVTAKHNLEVSYTDIEATPIDVSSFAGTDQTFQFRFTPGSVAGVRSFRIRLGPPASGSEVIVYNGSGDEIYNDSESFVYTEIA
jgi:hypothetical protein